MKEKMYLNPESYTKCVQDAVRDLVISPGSGIGAHPVPDKKYIWGWIAQLLKLSCDGGNKIIFIGNGGSAAIAGHMALDFSNAGKLRAVCFNDGPLLTCLANDYSYEKVFEKAIEMYADSADILVAISSSGESINILNGVAAAKDKGCMTVTLSGFSEDNSLRKLGDLNIYVPIPRPNYGPVEVCHYLLLQFVLDYIKNPA